MVPCMVPGSNFKSKYQAAQSSVASQSSPTTEEGSDEGHGQVKRIFAAIGIFAVLFVISRFDVALRSWIEDRAERNVQFEYADEYVVERNQPTFFDRLFCMGLKRAQSCD